jgi:hypothetical protein
MARADSLGPLTVARLFRLVGCLRTGFERLSVDFARVDLAIWVLELRETLCGVSNGAGVPGSRTAWIVEHPACHHPPRGVRLVAPRFHAD